jgi:hypothetical protein
MVGEATALDLIPRAVRDKLDRVGIKLHLKEWQQLSLEERAELRDLPCAGAEEVGFYRQRLEAMVCFRTGQLPEKLRKQTG